MPSQSYRVRIIRAGEEFEVEGDKAFVLDMVKRFEQEPGITRTTRAKSKKVTDDPPADFSTGTSKAISIREFVHQLKLKKHTDITLAFGYYLEHFADVKDFTPADINNCYYEAKMEGSNTSQMLIQNIKRRYLMVAKSEGKGRKRFTLTNSGEQFIESRLANPSD